MKSTNGAKRWSTEELNIMAEIRATLAEEIAQCGQFPEVIGDRSLIRFIRGHGHNAAKATEMFAKFLAWRKESNADEARQNIVHGGIDTPMKFPYGKEIIELCPQIVCAGDAVDKHGNPLALETYNFSPVAVLQQFTLEQYKEFVVYCLQYKTLIIEQLSEKKEREYLELHNGNPPDSEAGYGIVLQCTIIRDLTGLGFEFMGADSKAVLKVTMDVSADNFPEMLYKTIIVNAPWIFNTLWYVIKGWLDARTAAKVAIVGSKYKKELEAEIDPKFIPQSLGGTYTGYNEPFLFDTTEGGLLSYPHREYPFVESSDGGDGGGKISADDVQVGVEEEHK